MKMGLVSSSIALAATLVGCSSDGAVPGAGNSGTGGDAASKGGSPGGKSVTGGTTGSPGSGGKTTEPPPSTSCTAENKRTGEATYYTFADGSGNCGFDP